MGGGGRDGGAQEGGARLCLELAGQLEGVAEAQVPRAGGRVSGDDVLRVGADGTAIIVRGCRACAPSVRSCCTTASWAAPATDKDRLPGCISGRSYRRAALHIRGLSHDDLDTRV